MPAKTLTARVAQLEKTVAKLLRPQPGPPRQDLMDCLQNGLRPPGRDDWMTVVGMFDGDEEMERIVERGAAIRRAERRKARSR